MAIGTRELLMAGRFDPVVAVFMVLITAVLYRLAYVRAKKASKLGELRPNAHVWRNLGRRS
jgi:hypothetical protein